MIIHCNSCGKAVSNRLECCPFCTVSMHRQSREEQNFNPTLEDLIPAFRRKQILS